MASRWEKLEALRDAVEEAADRYWWNERSDVNYILYTRLVSLAAHGDLPVE